jgi:hypothetical protein
VGIEPFPAPCCDPQSPALLALLLSQQGIFPLCLAVFSTLFRQLAKVVVRGFSAFVLRLLAVLRFTAAV